MFDAHQEQFDKLRVNFGIEVLLGESSREGQIGRIASSVFELFVENSHSKDRES